MSDLIQLNFTTAPNEAVLQEKAARLRAILREFSRVIIAYSGGVDSAYLLHVAREELGENAQATIGISPSLMPEELDEARALANANGRRIARSRNARNG